MTSRENYVKQIHKLIDDMNHQIDELESKASSIKKQSREQYLEEVNFLRSKTNAVAEKLEELASMSGDMWDDIKQGVENAWNDLNDAVLKASTRLSGKEQ